MNQSPIITALLAHVTSECRAVNREDAYRAFLDDVHQVVTFGYLTFTPSQIIEECDPTAFRCGVNDHADSQDWTEVGGETYEDRDLEDAKTEFLSEKCNEIAAKEARLARHHKDTEGEAINAQERTDELKDELAALQGELAELEAHSF